MKTVAEAASKLSLEIVNDQEWFLGVMCALPTIPRRILLTVGNCRVLREHQILCIPFGENDVHMRAHLHRLLHLNFLKYDEQGVYSIGNERLARCFEFLSPLSYKYL